MPEKPWDKWYWSDYLGDMGLRRCSLSARGLWTYLLGIAAQSDRRGVLMFTGGPDEAGEISRLVSGNIEEIRAGLSELEKHQVFSRDSKKRIFNRRMVRDQLKAETARKNGLRGGNPSLSKQKQIRASDNLTSLSPRSQRLDLDTASPSLPFQSDSETGSLEHTLPIATKKKPATLIDLATWEPTDAEAAIIRNAGLDPAATVAEIHDWAANAAPAKRRKRDVAAFLRNWVRRERPGGQNWHASRRNGPASIVEAGRRVIERAREIRANGGKLEPDLEPEY